LKKLFIGDFLSQKMSMTDLCIFYGVSRKTGYKWIDRFKQHGLNGLADRSRAPLCHPNATAPGVEDKIVSKRKEFPCFGPKKLRVKLIEDDPVRSWPAASTIGAVLKRKGHVPSRKRRKKVIPDTEPFSSCDGPNQIWCADFKGWFRTGDQKRCDPLTITDAYSRFLIRCQSLQRTGFDYVRPQFEIAFREFGLPDSIRTDNGPPFASLGLAGLSRLSVWWIKLGIKVERIEPGKPQQNGRHERMHKTLKAAVANPPSANLRLQQQAFDHFWDEYNFQRPHEALGMKYPGDIYKSSPKKFPNRIRPLEYEDPFIVRSVRQNGCIRWKKELFLSETLAGEKVGLKWVDEHLLEIYFSYVKLAVLDVKANRIIRG
jgi:transposase InsO family protein